MVLYLCDPFSRCLVKRNATDTSLAVCLRTFAVFGILLMGTQSKVRQLDAVAVVAGVIHFHPVGDRPMRQLPGEDVDVSLFSAIANETITLSVVGKRPALASVFDTNVPGETLQDVPDASVICGHFAPSYRHLRGFRPLWISAGGFSAR